MEWIGPKSDTLTAVFRIKAEIGKQMVAVPPYTGAVLDAWERREGWYDLVENIHLPLLILDNMPAMKPALS
ncbi:hypothetical protein TRL7639_00382 [Falsiruegeria litorea R37]|uniref:Uncharacterized protein n=1 Tax=Falsiruegeria litorea R37 TaxID=1200284 RepID=A0A1Y5RKB3_9RHOB|nr:hypothetical protein [Falsiruegeria litorea]SLN18598.1 hypothetical protein TRL7639_00382 [Falsiruegeria litorea R37]